jgi:hypothetical protein
MYWTADDVLRLCAAAGAALLSFGSPPDNPSDVATRMLADAVGVQRPGATLYTSIALEPDGNALATAQAFVANDAGTTPVPAHEALFAYLQPEHVREALAQPWPELAEDPAPAAIATAPGEHVKQLYENAESLPGWVATSERFIDSNVGELARSAALSTTVTPSTKYSYEQGKQRAILELREIVDRHLGGT